MHVAVKQPVAQGVVEEQLQHPRGQFSAVMSGGVQCGIVADVDAFGPAKGHDPARRLFPLDHRHLKSGVPFRIRPEFGRGGTFQPQVQLAAHHPVEMVDHVQRAQAARCGRQGFDQRRGQIERIDILAECPFDAGAQHLDRHRLAGVAQGRLVDLRQRRGGDGFGKAGEHIVHPDPQLAFDFGFGQRRRKRRQGVLQHPQFTGQSIADNIGAGRQDLAELDVGGSEGGQRPRRRRQ